MKTLLLAASIALGTTHAVLADPAEDYISLRGIFTTAYDQTPELSGLEGEWLVMSLIVGKREEAPNPSEVSHYLETFCGQERDASRVVTVLSDRSLRIKALGSRPFEERLDWMGGSRFARSFDPDLFMSHVAGYDYSDNPQRDSGHRLWLSAMETPREITLYSPTRDTLVLDRAGIAQIFVRCP